MWFDIICSEICRVCKVDSKRSWCIYCWYEIFYGMIEKMTTPWTRCKDKINTVIKVLTTNIGVASNIRLWDVKTNSIFNWNLCTVFFYTKLNFNFGFHCHLKEKFAFNVLYVCSLIFLIISHHKCTDLATTTLLLLQ
jgi:hypothetical protein